MALRLRKRTPSSTETGIGEVTTRQSIRLSGEAALEVVDGHIRVHTGKTALSYEEFTLLFAEVHQALIMAAGS